MDTWASGYQGIRRVNEFIDMQDKHSEFSNEVNNELRAEVIFFRAYIMFHMAKRHGAIILRPDLEDIIKNKDKDKATEDEVWDFIEADINFAIDHLPATRDAADTGRLTKGAAYALKTRAMLYAKRWQAVIDAADEIFKLGYTLHDDYTSAWQGSKEESILEYRYQQTKVGPFHNFDLAYAPYGDSGNPIAAGTPTQEMVESYELATGGKVDWSAWHNTSGTTVRPPYELLEPRFHSSILYNGALWKGHVMQNSVDGTHGRYMDYRGAERPQGRTVTGYYLRKMMDESLRDLGKDKSVQTLVVFRLAEIYLNRAEAYYQLNKSSEALSDVNEIRKRVDLPVLTSLSGNRLFEAIRQERKIELFMEGHLYWDMRRWELAHIEYDQYRVHGLKITAEDGGGYRYEYVDADLQDRKFLKKTYVMPIPSTELANNMAIEQFDEWK